MTSIIGIPTTRVSDMFVRQRMLSQVQSDQLGIYRVQSQLSSGHRFEAPSEDPVAALRVMSLQSLIERKQQVVSNLNTNQSFLSATDSALSNVASMLADARASALGVLGTASTDTQRSAVGEEIGQLLRQLVDTTNQQFRGRYLFAGSTSTSQPLRYTDKGYVNFTGNDERLVSYGDVDLLFETSVSGVDLFGAISEPVRGTADLNPVLTSNTHLADLRGGKGLSRGSIAISDGTNTSIVDLSGAETVGDLAALIQANPPKGRSLTVDITPTNLVVTLDSNTTGSLSIREVGGGTLAGELGLLRPIGTGKSIAGRDLDPTLRLTTALSDICGVRARAAVRSAGTDNDILLEADRNGVETSDGKPLNGVTLSFVNDALVQPGTETVVYNGTDSIVVHVADGYTRASQVVAALNAAHDNGTIPFTARLDPLDNRFGGRGLIDVGATGETDYGEGEDFDKTAGLKIVNGGSEFTVAFPLATTVEDVLNTLNGAGAGVLAELNEARTGINLRSRTSGANFTIGENGGKTATQLGLRSFTNASKLEDLNFGRGVDDWAGSGARSHAVYDSLVSNSSLTFTALNPGTQWDEFDISFVNTAAAPSVDYDAEGKTLVFHINEGVTTANDVIALLQRNTTAATDWSASLTAPTGTTNNGTGKIVTGGAVVNPVETDGGDDSGVDFTITRADGAAVAIDITNKKTIGDIITAINNHDANADGKLVAQAAAYGNGIELIDNSSGSGSLTVTRAFLSQAAVDLGLVPAGADTSATATAAGYATTTIPSTAKKSGLIFTAKAAGTAANDVQVVFLEGGPVPPVYSEVADTLTFGITAGVTRALDIKAMLEASALNSTFSATFDPADTSGNTGQQPVAVTPVPSPRTGAGTATTYASVKVASAGYDNDLVFTAKSLGAAYNNVAVTFAAVTGGPTQVASYNPGVELVIQFDPGVATANDIIAAVAAHGTANAAFSVTRDPADASPNNGTGFVDPTDGTEPHMSGGMQSLVGSDVNPLETDSIFTALMRIQQGLETNDQFLIERSLALLDRKTVDMGFGRAELGAQQQGVDVLKSRLDTEDVELQQALSLDYDADLASVISDLTSRQAAFEASLQAMGKIFQMSLLDYL